MTLANVAGSRLLIVDDVESNRRLLSRRFASRGFEIIEAENGLTALEIISQQNVDLVLLDIMMPEPNGIEVLKTIRAKHSPDSLPVIMVTAKTFSQDIVQALELGANDYVTKPVDFPVALARVQGQLARKRAQQALARSIRELEETNRKLESEIAERKRSEARVQHMTHYDALTGLANRALFHEQLIRALRRMDQHNESLAVLFLDLDEFKLVNNTLGNPVGDGLLNAVGERLRNCIQETDTVARVGGDKFAIIQTRLTKPEEASRLADTIAEAIATPYDVEGHHVVLGCSIGISLAPTDGSDPDLLLSNADLAHYRAKAEGRSTCRFFEAEMNARAQAQRVLESDLRKALLAGEFELFYQPLFNLAASTISGFEALLRWHHPDRGMISPAEFIPLAEEIGLIVPLGAWLLRQACTEAARWPEETKLAVNISPVQFRSRCLVQDVSTALAASGLPASRLELEITETVVLNHNRETLSILHQLRSMGVRISMDDFGTGYSSLSYLRKFPFDKIKIDQTFIRDLACQSGTVAIVRAITSLASSLGMITTAEGVETQEQLEWLQAEGCTEVQGYLISPPVPAKNLHSLMENICLARKVA
jgi:diguanylate cyclase (GGDEF)-like protein